MGLLREVGGERRLPSGRVLGLGGLKRQETTRLPI
jgi:hypothetical protein